MAEIEAQENGEIKIPMRDNFVIYIFVTLFHNN